MKQGIIIGAIAFKENSKIIYILTDEGRDSLLVNNAKKINAKEVNQTQLLNIVSYEKIKDNGLSKPKVLDVIDYNFDIKNDIKKYTLFSYILEIIGKLNLENYTDGLLYNLITKFNEQLKKREDYLTILLEMKIKMLYFLGINPYMQACIHCLRRDNLVGLSLKSGGMECLEHRSDDNIGIESTKILDLLYHDKTLEIKIDNEEVTRYLYKVINEYYDIHFGESFKSERLLTDLKII